VSDQPILSIELRVEDDVVMARQRARDIARVLKFDEQDCTRIATAVSEIARNAFRYARDGRVIFVATPAALEITVTDRGPGIARLDGVLDGTYVSSTGMGMGIVGAKRLVDELDITTSGEGTTVILRKRLRPGLMLDTVAMGRATGSWQSVTPYEEVRLQNRELVRALEELRERNLEVERLSQELGDTNRGVLALYADLDEKAESLRQASDLKSRFLSNMSHEFRTPLNSILSITGLLQMQVDGPLTPEQQKQIDYVRSSARSLIEMVNDLLDIAKIEAGKTEVKPSEVSLPELFAALRGMFRPLATNERVALEIEPPPAVTIRADEAKLSQIVRNFIANALKYTNEGRVRVWAAVENGTLAISVADTGIGIPGQYLDSIFQEFVQVENPLQKKAKGTGLGLPLSRRLAQLLGGDVSVQSELGKGSTFTVSIPADWSEPVPAPRPAELTPAGEARARVLIIDDDETSRYVLRSLLPDGCRVEEAADGPEGIIKAKEDVPDIIFVDVMMPTMNGIEVMKRLRHDPVTAGVPVVVRTSKTLTEEERRTLSDEGVLGVLSKTYDSIEKSTADLRAIFARVGPVENRGR
jgi:signal transduction histidine kinase